MGNIIPTFFSRKTAPPLLIAGVPPDHLADPGTFMSHFHCHAPPDVVAWMTSLHPVHRCSVSTLQSILELGVFFSRERLGHVSGDDIVTLMVSHPSVVAALAKTSLQEETIRAAATSYDGSIDTLTARGIPIELAKPLHTVWAAATYLTENVPRGKAFHGDIELGTHQTVFATLGPNNFDYGPIHVEFSRGVLEHHATFVTPIASSMYYNGTHGELSATPGRHDTVTRPWTKGTGLVAFQEESFPAADEKTTAAMACEFIARVGQLRKIPPGSVTLDMVRAYISDVAGHYAVHVYLPGIVSIGYVRRVVIPEREWVRLSPEQQVLAKEYMHAEVVKCVDSSLMVGMGGVGTVASPAKVVSAKTVKPTAPATAPPSRPLCHYGQYCKQQSTCKNDHHPKADGVCPAVASGGRCRSMTDKVHRERYDHPGHYAYLVQCDSTSCVCASGRCKDSDCKHCKKHYHAS